MKRYVTEKLNRWLTDFVRDRSIGQPPTVVDHYSYPLPQVAKADAAISANNSGTFILQKNRPGALLNHQVDGVDAERTAYALCDIDQDAVCFLLYCGGPSSLGYWLAVPCGTTSGETACSHCTTGQMPASVTVKYETTHNGLSLEGGVDWAAETSGTHSISMGGCSGTKIIEHGQSTVLMVDNVTSQSYPIGSDLRSRIVLSAELPDAINAGFALRHYREVKDSVGTWNSFENEGWFNWSGTGATMDCTANRALTIQGQSLGFGEWIAPGYDVQVNP